MRFPEILGFDHVTLCVPNPGHWHSWFIEQLGFAATGSYLQLGGVRLALTCDPEYLAQHPAGVSDICFRVSSLAQTTAALEGIPQQLNLATLTIPAIGAVSHSFREGPALAPGALTGIDHVVFNLGQGEMPQVLAWYEQVLGWTVRERYQISGSHSALSSCVVANPAGTVQIPLNESRSAASQIQEFLDYNRGAGVQHIALGCSDIFEYVKLLQEQGIKFLAPPANYYQNHLGSKLYPDQLQRQGILCDFDPQDAQRHLLQIFTQPLFGMPTFFLEFIQRLGARQGFGVANFQALFVAMEREQARRGAC